MFSFRICRAASAYRVLSWFVAEPDIRFQHSGDGAALEHKP